MPTETCPIAPCPVRLHTLVEYPRGVSIASRIVFRDLTSTKQKALWISLEFLKNAVECCRRATPLPHEIPEFLQAVLGSAGQAVKIIPSDTSSFPDKSLKDWAPSWTSVMVFEMSSLR